MALGVIGKPAKRSLVKTLRAGRVARARRMIDSAKFLTMQADLAKLLQPVLPLTIPTLALVPAQTLETP